MKKLFLFLLFTTINTHPMDDMALDEDPQNTPSPVWKQIPWRLVPRSEISLEDRIKNINSIIRTLSGVVGRLEKLPCDSSKKTVVAQKIKLFVANGITIRNHIVTNRLDPDDIFEDLHLKQVADQFLDPYHKTEDHLRTSIENLERMAREHNHNGMNDLLERLASLSLE